MSTFKSLLPWLCMGGLLAAQEIPHPSALDAAAITQARIADLKREALIIGNGDLNALLWARLHRGDLALETIREQLRTQVNENLFNRCGGPFQIDGNLGTPAAIAEMLLQSHAGEIHLLPALPQAWAGSGSFKGLRARGGYTVDCQWTKGEVTGYRITAKQARPVKVRVNGAVKTITARKS